jgi:hypothetical protein
MQQYALQFQNMMEVIERILQDQHKQIKPGNRDRDISVSV